MSEAPPDLPKALLVGEPGSGKFCLARALVGRDIDKSYDREYRITLDNKYYTAEVAVHAASARHAPPIDLADCQALVLVVDAARPGSFAALEAWHAAHDSEQIDVRLVVATKADLLPTGSAARLREVQAWASQNLFEYIETAAEAPHVDAALQLDGDAQGVARVRAALSAHHWPGLVMKPRSGTGDAARPRPPPPVGAPAETRGAPEALAAASSLSGNGATAAGHAAAAAGQPAPSLAGPWVPFGDGEGELSEEAGEQLVDEFEHLMSQVAGVRARAGSVPDAQRREAAAALAYQLAAMLGLDEGGSSSGEQEEDTDEEAGTPAANGWAHRSPQHAPQTVAPAAGERAQNAHEPDAAPVAPAT